MGARGEGKGHGLAGPLGSPASLRHVTCRRAHLRGDGARPPAHTRGTAWRPHARHRRAPARGRQALPATAPRAPHLGSTAPRLTWPRPGSGPHAGLAPRPAPLPRPCPRGAVLREPGLPGSRGAGRGRERVVQVSPRAGRGSSSEPLPRSSGGAPEACLVQGPA